MGCIPFPSSQLFEIHGSKFKLHPVGHLGEASVLRIAHAVFLFCIGEHTLYFLFSQPVQLAVYWGVPGILSQFHKILSDMPHHRLFAFGVCGAFVPGRAGIADIRSALVFPVTIPVGGGIMQCMVLRANNIVIPYESGHTRKICTTVRADYQTEDVKSIRQGGRAIGSYLAGCFFVGTPPFFILQLYIGKDQSLSWTQKAMYFRLSARPFVYESCLL